MESVDTGRLIYLLILVLALLGWLVMQTRHSLNRTLQQAAVWALIFFGAIAAFGLWDDISRAVKPRQASFADGGRIVVPRQADGHYYLTAILNGKPVEFVVDTGASDMVLTRKDAATIGLEPATLNYFGRATTANGNVRTAPVRLDTVTLGAFTDRDIPAVVNGSDMEQSLLGMDYLQRWGRIEISGGELTLTR